MIKMEQKIGKLSDVDPSKVSLLDAVQFFKGMHPSIVKALIREYQMQSEGEEKEDEMMILIRDGLLDFSAAGGIRIDTFPPMPDLLVTSDISMVKTALELLLEDGVDEERIFVVKKVKI